MMVIPFLYGPPWATTSSPAGRTIGLSAIKSSGHYHGPSKRSLLAGIGMSKMSGPTLLAE
jgi:hypothetical protein